MEHKSYLKKFTYEEIEKKCALREKQIPQYRQLLFEALVEKLDDGIIFNLKHPSWQKLVQLVKQHKNKENKNEPFILPYSVDKIPEITQVTPLSIETKIKLEALLSDLLLKPENEIDVSITRKICRSLCFRSEGINDSSRAKIWKLMLLSDLNPAFNKKLHSFNSKNEIKFDLFNQRVIKNDIERTRTSLPLFQNLVTKHTMEYLLTFFCKSHNISYKQGLNYLLVPFIVLELGSLEETYRYFSAFMDAFLPKLFTDNEFNNLQCLFKLFRLLILYHDPLLCFFLDQFNMSPELYTSSWFVTFFTNKLEIDVLLSLFDILIVSKDPILIYFICLAILLENRKEILNQNVVTLPTLLTSLSIRSRNEVSILAQRGKVLSLSTPISFKNMLLSAINDKLVEEKGLSASLENQVCTSVSASELIKSSCPVDSSELENKSQDEKNKVSENTINPIKFFVIDYRTLEEYESGHLPTAYHIDINSDSNKIQSSINTLSSMIGCHFCVIGNQMNTISAAEFNQTLIVFLLSLLEKGFRYVSYVEGGFKAIHTLASQELVDHKSSTCLECNSKKPTLLSSFRNRIENIINTRKLSRYIYSYAQGLSFDDEIVSPQNGIASNRISESDNDIPHFILSNKPECVLLLTVLRDNRTPNSLFYKCVLKLISLLFSQSFDIIPRISLSETSLSTTSDSFFTGYLLQSSILIISFSSVFFKGIIESLSVYSNVCHDTKLCLMEYSPDTFSFNIKSTLNMLTGSSSNITFPDSLKNYQHIWLFFPIVIHIDLINELMHQLQSSIKINENDIAVFSLVVGDSFMSKMSSLFPNISVITIASDIENNGIIKPGIGDFYSRFAQ